MELEVFSDLSERLRYNLPGFPLYARKGELRTFHRYAAACHWHPDLEFILILDGAMDYFINSDIVRMKKGEGIFVSSKRLHYGFSKNNTDCTFIALVVHPSLIGGETHVGNEYFTSQFGSGTEDYILLRDTIEWQNSALKAISLIYDEMHCDSPSPVRMISQAASLCACIGDNIQPVALHDAGKHSLMAVWNMTGYIFQHYGDRITLDDIAASGSVCRSKCCRLFNEYVGQSPNVYLTNYRIKKSCEMLKESTMSVMEVALACGFQSHSYFTQIFQKEVGLSPKEYRHTSLAASDNV